jgi:hypothetical protein
MKKLVSCSTRLVSLVVLAALVFLPVIVEGVPTHSVNASVTNETPAVGDPVTIFGTVTGNTLPADVQIWVFAGTYVNVSNVDIDAAGGFSKTYSTTGLPPATYYVVVQSPGPNGEYNIDLEESGIFSGQVVNTANKTLILNFTGSGSVRDKAALQALSEAINEQGVDDAYTKLTFTLMGSAPVTQVSMNPATTTMAATPATTASKSPVGLEIAGLALVIGGLGAAMRMRK